MPSYNTPSERLIKKWRKRTARMVRRAETRGFIWFIGQMARHERRQRAASRVGVDLADGLYDSFDSDTQCILWSLASQFHAGHPIGEIVQPWLAEMFSPGLEDEVPTRRNLEI